VPVDDAQFDTLIAQVDSFDANLPVHGDYGVASNQQLGTP